jgi:hypothetical protein
VVTRLHPILFIITLYLLGTFIGSVLIDSDHIIAPLLGIKDLRFLHLPFVVVSGGALALCGGLWVAITLHKRFLK